MKPSDLSKILSNENARKRNPEAVAALASVESPLLQRFEPEALHAPLSRKPERGDDLRKSKGGPMYSITFVVSHSQRILDSDNLKAGAMIELKPIRDAIARDLGLDDCDGLIKWEYEFLKSDRDYVLILFWII